ncbi:MAG: glycine oxidase ThiO [Nocardioides sp.]|nr:glycine oxidase ThiO [Nocardioides sp.]
MRVLVLGAGLIGLSVADELLRRGHRVTVVDPAPGQGTSYAAAGMLSPGSEVWHGEAEILRLGLRSLALWPSYAERLGVSLHCTGTLLVGQDRGDLQQVERQAELLAGLGDRPRMLTGPQARAAEPTLGPRVVGGALLPEDHSVDPREVLAALLDRVGRPAKWLSGRPERRTSRRTSCDVAAAATGTQDVSKVGKYDATVVATGATLPEPWRHLVRGVRGEILRGHTDDPPKRTVRAWVHGQPVYVVPRPGGDLVIGATNEEHDVPPEVTFGGVFTLVEAARALLPGLDRATFTEALARDRPATSDNLPLLGPAPDRDDVVLAAGFFRHGVLLAPLAARLVADHLESGSVEPLLDPGRFTRSTTEGARC